MKLITETVENTEIIIEEGAGGVKNLYITGPFLVAETKNKNGRIYRAETLEREVNRYTQECINKNRGYGELSHPDTPSINLDRVSHMVTSLTKEGNVWIGKAKILETPMGKIARALIEGGASLGVSSRGMGTLKEVNGVNIVQDDYHLAAAADLVADPSGPSCFVNGIMENKEFYLVNGKVTEQVMDGYIKDIKKASSKDIEAVSLRIFENFIRRL